MPGKRKGRLKEFQRKTDNANLEEQRKLRKQKLEDRKQEIESKRKRKNPEERKRYKLNRTRAIRWTVILVVLIFVGWWTYRIGSLTYENSQLQDENSQKTQELQEKQDEYKNSDTDEYIEKKAREYKMVKPGEKLFVLDKDKGNNSDSNSEDK